LNTLSNKVSSLSSLVQLPLFFAVSFAFLLSCFSIFFFLVVLTPEVLLKGPSMRVLPGLPYHSADIPPLTLAFGPSPPRTFVQIESSPLTLRSVPRRQSPFPPGPECQSRFLDFFLASPGIPTFSLRMSYWFRGVSRLSPFLE